MDHIRVAKKGFLIDDEKVPLSRQPLYRKWR